MTTQLNGTEFVTLKLAGKRPGAKPANHTTIASRRDQRRVRRANRAI